MPTLTFPFGKIHLLAFEFVAALEKEKKELEITILQEKIKKPFLTKEQIRFGIEKFGKVLFLYHGRNLNFDSSSHIRDLMREKGVTDVYTSEIWRKIIF